MKLIRIGRRALATLLVASILAIGGTAGANEGDVHTDPGAEGTSPVILDLLFLRPLGLVGTITGAALYIAPVLPLTLITRPSEAGRPFHGMVVKPARYVFADPIGMH